MNVNNLPICFLLFAMSQDHFHYETQIVDSPLKKHSYTRIAIYDFDSTLFKSPLPNPQIWTRSFVGTIISDCQWFLDKRTLNYPFVPEIPGPKWWKLQILESARLNINRQDTLTILLTGRRKADFESRIKDLCRQQGLDFNYFFLKELESEAGTRCHKSTINFKISVLNYLLDHFIKVRELELFDDRLNHLKVFEQDFERRICSGQIDKFAAVLVDQDAPQEDVPYMDKDLEFDLVSNLINLCNRKISAFQLRESEFKKDGLVMLDSNDSDRKSIYQFRNSIELTEFINYTGIMLEDVSVQRLDKAFPLPEGYIKKCHHVTVSIGKANEALHEKLGGFGSQHSFFASHFGFLDGLVSAVKVQGETLVSENQNMHITLYVSPTGSSKLSNKITNWEELPVMISLSGEYRKDVRYGIKRDSEEPQIRQEISVGTLVLKHHPHLTGKNVGQVVKFVKQWMNSTCTENIESNKALVEMHIERLCINDIIK